MSFFKRTLEKRTSFLILAVFLMVIGVVAFKQMPRSLFPEVNYPRVVVVVNMGYAPLQVMEWGIASPLEKELRSVPGVRLVKSASSRGTATIDVFLQQNQKVTNAVQRVNAKISEARSQLPPGAQISVRPITAAAFPGAEYCFTSKKMSTRDLRSFVEYTIKPQILLIPGIFNAGALGGDLPQFTVALDPRKMALHNLTVSEIRDRIKNSNGVDFLGPVEEKSGAEVLAFGGKFTQTEQEIGNIVVDSSVGRAVRLKDVGYVNYGNAWKTQQIDVNGTECALLDIYYQEGIDQQKTSAAVKNTINHIVKSNPGLKYKSWDLNDFTDRATSAVIGDLLFGMLIIALVTFGFLRDLRYSLVALASMPLATAFTFLAMKGLHLSINLMTLGGLAAAIGLVVDNTVIVLEMYHHQTSLHPERPRNETLRHVLTQVARPMIFGTLTIALVFAPIGMLSGLSGMFFAPMAAVGSSALILSVFLALFVVPGLIALFDRGRRPSHNVHTGKGRLLRAYDAILSFCLRRRKRFLCLLILLPLLGLTAVRFAKTGFLPIWDEGDLVIDYRAKQPLGLQATVEKLKPFEAYLKSIPGVDFFIRKTGTDMGTIHEPPYIGEIVFRLKDKRKLSVFQISDQIAARGPKLAPGFEFDLHQILPDRLNDLSGAARPIVLYLRGPNEDKLDQAAKVYKDALSKIKGLGSVEITQPEKAPEFLYKINEELTQVVGLDPSQVDENARFGLFSVNASSVQVGPQTIPIRLQMAGLHESVGRLAETPLYTAKGGLKRLGQFGKIETVRNRVEADHINGQSIRSVTAELAGLDLGTAVKRVKAAIKAHPMKDVYTQLGGTYKSQQKSFRELIFAFLTGIALIFLMSLFFSNRLKIAGSVALVSLIPPSAGLFGLVVSGIPLDVSAFAGLISVTGIAVANTFMALSAIEAEPAYMSDPVTAIKNGMGKRLRPILMTNFAAMAGFIPIAISLSKGDEILRPFSIAIIIGLFGALYTTLVVVPTGAKFVLRQGKASLTKSVSAENVSEAVKV